MATKKFGGWDLAVSDAEYQIIIEALDLLMFTKNDRQEFEAEESIARLVDDLGEMG